MKTLHSTLMALTALIATASAQTTTYVIGLPNMMTETTATEGVSIFLDVVKGADPGDRIEVFDAYKVNRILSFDVPAGRSVDDRLKKVAPLLKPLKTFLGRARSVKSGREERLRVPQFANMISNSLRTKGGDVHAILLGRPFYEDKRDVGCTFSGNGFVPSDGHILASVSKSPFGTKEKEGALEGVTFHWHYLSEDVFHSTPEAAAIERFWGCFLQAQGAHPGAFLSDRSKIVERALEDVEGERPAYKIDPKDTKIEMRRVGPAPSPDPAPAPEKPKKQPKPPVAISAAKTVEQSVPKIQPKPEMLPVIDEPRSVDLIIVCDGSISQETALKEAKGMVTGLAEKSLAVTDVDLRLGVVIYRGRDATDQLPLTALDSVAGIKGKGHSAVKAFVNDKVREVSIANFVPGDEEGKTTGQTKKVSRFVPLGAYVDFEHGIALGIEALLRTPKGTVPVLVVMGDAVHELGDPKRADDYYDRKAIRESLRGIEDLAKAQPDLRVFSVFSGGDARELRFGEEALSFFKEFAVSAGPGASFVDSIAAAEREVTALLTGAR